jgi:RimJ/RimL family protein N-acetyltransferase
MKYVKKLESKRIYLSPARVEDADLYVSWLNDPKITNYLGTSQVTLTSLNEKKLLEELLSKKDPFFAIVDKEEDKLIGNTSFFNIDRLSQSSEIGIFIGDEKYRDKGIGQEVMTLMLDYGFNILNFHSIYLHPEFSSTL